MVPQPNAAAADVGVRGGVSEYTREYKGPAGLAARTGNTAGAPSRAVSQSARAAKLSQLSARAQWTVDGDSMNPRTVQAACALTDTAARLASLPAWGSPGASRQRRVSVADPKTKPKRTDITEAQTVICAQWEAWAQSIARAVDEEQPLPAPPVPDADTVGVTPTLLRILQASAFAAAALARNLKQAEVWKEEVDNLDLALTRSRAYAERLQDTINSLQEDRNNFRDSGKNLHESLQALQITNTAQTEQLRQMKEEFDEERDRRVEAERRLEDACPNCARSGQVVEDLQDELDRLEAVKSDEVMEARKQAAEAMRLARIADKERRELNTVLQRLVASDNNFRPAAVSPIAALPKETAELWRARAAMLPEDLPMPLTRELLPGAKRSHGLR